MKKKISKKEDLFKKVKIIIRDSGKHNMKITVNIPLGLTGAKVYMCFSSCLKKSLLLKKRENC